MNLSTILRCMLFHVISVFQKHVSKGFSIAMFPLPFKDIRQRNRLIQSFNPYLTIHKCWFVPWDPDTFTTERYVGFQVSESPIFQVSVDFQGGSSCC